MDKISSQTRSKIMSRIRSKGNSSTEIPFRMLLVRSGFSGWKMHLDDLPGRPDFVFKNERVAIFIDGCFWHGCPKCCRMPKSRIEYWKNKIRGNIIKDKKNNNKLKKLGYTVLRFWEHELKKDLDRIIFKIKKKLEC